MFDGSGVTPDVKGTFETAEAPENAGACELAVVTGMAAVMLGLRTLMTDIN